MTTEAGEADDHEDCPSPGALMPVGDAQITCPACGHTARAQVPVNRCVIFYDCPACEYLLVPKPGDCCVFCSYGDRRCPLAGEAPPC